MKILVVGDSYITSADFRSALAELVDRHEVEFMDVSPQTDYEPSDDSEGRLIEYEGSPDQVAAALSGHEALVVHGAPVSLKVLMASPALRLVCCARGGPVNIDTEAAARLGIEVVTTPGKNAGAVADLTLGLAIMLARSVDPAMRFLRDGGQVLSTFDGARFFGSELSELSIGLVGLGRVGMEVSSRARGFGMEVFAYDPFVEPELISQAGAQSMNLRNLVRHCDIVSLHARQTEDNRKMVNADLLADFKGGGLLINTAREGLLAEEPVLESLRSGHLAGLAVDVFETNGPIAKAAANGEERLIALPHIGGATVRAIKRAAAIITARIEAFENWESAPPVLRESGIPTDRNG